MWTKVSENGIVSQGLSKILAIKGTEWGKCPSGQF